MNEKATREDLEKRITRLEAEASTGRLTEEALRESEGVLRCMLEAMPVGVAFLKNRVFKKVNTALCTITGYAEEEILEMPTRFLYANDEEFQLAGRELYERMERDGLGVKDAVLRRKDGELIDVVLSLSPFDPEDPSAGVCATIQEITDRKRVEKALRESEKKYRLLAEGTTDIIWTLDLNLNTTYVSPSILKVLGFAPEERMLMEVNEMMTPESYARAMDILIRELDMEREGKVDPDRSMTVEIEYYHKKGHTVWTENMLHGIRDQDGNLIGVHGVSRDITERKRIEAALRESEERYRELSIVDGLTQLYNSRHFYNQLRMELNRADRYKQPLTLLLLDLDNFKAFNDTYGHLQGDHILSRFGEVVRRQLRQADSAYRYGGEEFTILLPMTTSANGTVAAERIRSEFRKENFSPVPGKGVHMTVSIGVAQYEPGEDTKALVDRADRLMYLAKKTGKDRVCSDI